MPLRQCPLHIPQKVKCCKKKFIDKNYKKNRVFVNIPYNPSYRQFEIAICAALLAYELYPVVVKNVYSGTTRICEICKNIYSCKYGISDIWYDNKNIPFELGFMLASGRFNLVLHKNRKKAVIECSDIGYFDAGSHYGDVEKLIVELAEKIPLKIHDAIQERLEPEHIYRAYRYLLGKYRTKRFEMLKPQFMKQITVFLKMARNKDKISELKQAFSIR